MEISQNTINRPSRLWGCYISGTELCAQEIIPASIGGVYSLLRLETSSAMIKANTIFWSRYNATFFLGFYLKYTKTLIGKLFLSLYIYIYIWSGDSCVSTERQIYKETIKCYTSYMNVVQIMLNKINQEKKNKYWG